MNDEANEPGTYVMRPRKQMCNLMPREALGRLAVLKLPTSQNPPPLDPFALKKKKKKRKNTVRISL